MSSFSSNSHLFNVITENELAEVLSHYNSEFIYSIVDEAMKARFLSVPIISIPNVVGAWEQNFKAIKARYGSDSTDEVIRVRNETYTDIINAIFKEFGLDFTIDDTVDLYSAAFHLYNLFISDFTSNMISFFANFIYKERNNIYESLELSEMKKNKDTSTIYGKKVYKDIKLAIINANIELVIDWICSTEIPFHNIVGVIYGNNSELKRYILSIVSSNEDFFNNVYMPIIKSSIRPDIITAIRFKLQEIASSHEQTLSSSEIELYATQGNSTNIPEVEE